jgi:hypothetical protein
MGELEVGVFAQGERSAFGMCGGVSGMESELEVNDG